MATLVELIVTRGLPGSGKSTWAAEEKARLEANHYECVIVNKDDIRKELVATGWVWSQKNEQDVIRIRDLQIRTALNVGQFVISSDCNFGKHKEHLRTIAKDCGVSFRLKDFTSVDVPTCVRRDAARPADQRVGADVIKGMYEKYLALPDLVPYVADPTKPKAIICDLDGTLALFAGKRGPYDAMKCAGDAVNKPIAEILWAMEAQGYAIIFVSGREEKAKEPTLEFFQRNHLPVHHPLFMRKTGDFRKDFLVKQELFDNHIRNCYNVRFVLDDRDSVVAMWRKLGLVCLQVAEGAF